MLVVCLTFLILTIPAVVYAVMNTFELNNNLSPSYKFIATFIEQFFREQSHIYNPFFDLFEIKRYKCYVVFAKTVYVSIVHESTIIFTRAHFTKWHFNTINIKIMFLRTLSFPF